MAKEISPPINFVRDQNANCTNSISSHTCTCRNGSYPDGGKCFDVNECFDDLCSCKTDYASDGMKIALILKVFIYAHVKMAMMEPTVIISMNV